MTYIPPKCRVDIICTEELNEDTPRLKFGKVTDRRLGLYFKFGGLVYLYGYPKTNYEFQDIDMEYEVVLLDLRKNDGENYIPLEIKDNQFKLVEIIESDGRFALSDLLIVDTVNVAYWVFQGLERVFERMHDRYLMNRALCEGVDDFLRG